MTVTFFGHRDAPQIIESAVKRVLIELIERHGADTFFVGNQGAFDAMVKRILAELKTDYPQINYTIVLAYFPVHDKNSNNEWRHTIYPHEIENVPRKYAIDKRNRWMVENSDIVVVYVKYPTGGAEKFRDLAERKGRRVINIANELM